MKNRLLHAFGSELSEYEVIGVPKDVASARALADQNKYQFECWANSLVDAHPSQQNKKGADRGIDGFLYFFDDESTLPKKILVQVKGGHVSVSQIRDLVGTIDREKAVIGAFITLNDPTGPMKREAASAGFYQPADSTEKYPRVQILTIQELFDGKKMEYPRWAFDVTHKRAQRKSKVKKEDQIDLL